MLNKVKIYTLTIVAFVLIAASSFLPQLNAQDKFEIQVYDSNINKPFEAGLELHSNYTNSGRSTQSYAGEIPPNHTGRFTLEPALGITQWLEIGSYLQFIESPDRDGFAGIKFRSKFVIPGVWHWPIMLGLNMEVSYIPRRAEHDAWGSEFRPIIGWENGYLFFYVNPIIDLPLSGNDRFRPEFDPCAKTGFNTQLGFAFGLEYYSGYGAIFYSIPPLREQQHLLFLAFDLMSPLHGQGTNPFDLELNIGIGRALSAGTDQQWIVKIIIGRAF